jgi:CRP-like cAMP-binding protein
VVSGRLRAIRVADDGTRKVLGDVAAGETVGEAAVLSGVSRSATVVAARDSVLVRVDAASLNAWCRIVLLADPRDDSAPSKRHRIG